MGLRDLPLQSSYETEENRTHLLDEFYVPVLEQASSYYRIAGFFSSTALTVAARGIEGLIHNGGKMYLLISPVLSRRDFETIRLYGGLREDSDLFQTSDFLNQVTDSVRALAWLLANDRLKIKIVVGRQSSESLFHQKVGIVTDAKGDQISFSGSVNETAQGWMTNIEEFKVFRSWESGQLEYVRDDFRKFLDFWKNKRPNVAAAYDLPEAIQEKLLQVRPDDIMELSLMCRYGSATQIKEKPNALSLFPHQQEAVQRWKENQGSLLMEMATGTGKTRTAIGCMVEALKKEKQLLAIVATPQNTLSRQWQADLKKLGIRLDEEHMIDGSNPHWRRELKLLLLNLGKTVYQAIIFTTHKTASSESFLKLIENHKEKTKILFICDEVHAIGADKQRQALLPAYEYRIGLSATPERLFDEEGSSLIREYFGQASFEFSIADALSTINPLTGKPFLNPYAYHPLFIYLTEEEYKCFKQIQKKIAVLVQNIRRKEQEHRACEEERKNLESQYRRRANVIKNAGEKIGALNQLLDRFSSVNVQDTILFVSDKQMPVCMKLLADKGITHAKITEEISARKMNDYTGLTERQQIIADFSNHALQVILGIKCLDEGIDITSARIAILLANSVNPREYIQRIGRVIRPGKGKARSEIFDFIVLGNDGKPLLNNELRRVAFIAENAENREEVYRLFRRKGVNLDEYQQTDSGTN